MTQNIVNRVYKLMPMHEHCIRNVHHHIVISSAQISKLPTQHT